MIGIDKNAWIRSKSHSMAVCDDVSSVYNFESVIGSIARNQAAFMLCLD